MEFLVRALLGLLVGMFVYGIFGLILLAIIIYLAAKKRRGAAFVVGIVLLFYLLIWILVVWQRPFID